MKQRKLLLIAFLLWSLTACSKKMPKSIRKNFDPWSCWEVRYKVIDRNTLQYISASNLKDKSAQALEIFEAAEEKGKYLPAKFIPCEVIPPPNSWLKKESGFGAGK